MNVHTQELPTATSTPAPIYTDPNAPASYSLAILGGLQEQRHIYGGTVPFEVVADRRRKNRAARKSRRINRRSA